jgi:gamma-glutamyltranspeptidase/glutathione hydrolase
MMTRADGSLYGPFGVMGGFMQPQGHAQVVIGLIDDGLDPQAALNRLRVCLEPGEASGDVAMEDGLPLATVSRLAELGHAVGTVSGYGRAMFGRGQIIRRDLNGVLWGGSDPRADGCAMGF